MNLGFWWIRGRRKGEGRSGAEFGGGDHGGSLLRVV